MDNAMSAAARALLGQRSVLRRGLQVVVPAHGARVLRSLVAYAADSGDDITGAVLSGLGLSASARRVVESVKKIVPVCEDKGGGYSVVDRIPGVAADALSNYTASEFGQEDVAVVDASEKTLQLNAVFTDATLADKLQLSSRRLQVAKRVCTDDPIRAAADLTDALRPRFPNYVVKAGDYAKSKNNARNRIRKFASAIARYVDASAPARVTTNRLFISFDQFRGEVAWTAEGPLNCAVEVQCIYQMSIERGPEQVMFLLGTETMVLGIEVRDVNGVCYTGSAAGYSSLSGIQPEGYALPAGLTANQSAELYQCAKKIRPVRGDDGQVVATAVCVSDRFAVVNTHTLRDAGASDVRLTVDGAELVGGVEVAPDVTVVSGRDFGAQWIMREPHVDERVVLCYHVGSAVEYTEVLRVASCIGDVLLLTESSILRKGASGAVVVALSDFAILGVFCRVSARRVECSVFTTRHLMSAGDADDVSSVGQVADGSAFGDLTFEKFKKRGLTSRVVALSRALTQVYAGVGRLREAAATAVNVAGQWYTAGVEGDVACVMADGKPVNFIAVRRGVGVCVDPPPVLATVPAERSPRVRERVCVMARDGEEIVMSRFTEVVSVAGEFGFRLAGIGGTEENLLGGVVVAESDAAVLGIYLGLRRDVFDNEQVVCSRVGRALPTVSSSAAGAAVSLSGDLIFQARLRGAVKLDEAEQRLAQAGALVFSAESALSAAQGSVRASESAVSMVELTIAQRREFSRWFMRDCLELDVESDRFVIPAIRMEWMLGYVCLHHSGYRRLVVDKLLAVVEPAAGAGESTPRALGFVRSRSSSDDDVR